MADHPQESSVRQIQVYGRESVIAHRAMADSGSARFLERCGLSRR